MQEHCAWHFCTWSLDVRGNFYGMNPVQLKGQWTVENQGSEMVAVNAPEI
jgi:hypothetical protein